MTPNPISYWRVALDLPIADDFDYCAEPELAETLSPGSWILAPWGRGRRMGLVLGPLPEPRLEPARIRALQLMQDAPPPDRQWLALGEFASRYYHRPIGEVLLPSIPKLLRSPPSARGRGSALQRARERYGKKVSPAPQDSFPPPTDAQRSVLEALEAANGFKVHLLHGVTGSGKTEVYLRWLAAHLDRDPQAQVLLLVPEIGLTPQLHALVVRRFPGLAVAVLHSNLADGERAAHWLAAAEGHARIIIGTRMAVLAPMPRLAAIVIDEEHDPSYRQQEGVRYSARDLAIALAAQRKLPVLMGSATPSLESWHAAARGKYQLHRLAQRAGGGSLPRLRLVDTSNTTLRHGLSAEAIDAIGQALGRSAQAMVFMNRRGYAPVLHCPACQWVSRCDHCSAFRVLHRLGRPGSAPGKFQLVCHHCSSAQVIPARCPTCGNPDLKPVGQGTQKLEEGLAELFPAARIARLDRDVARRRGGAERVLAQVHAGDVDILLGTQMLAKGHDFERLSTVVVADADGGLYAADFRAPERLFATLMQVAGRAGRAARSAEEAQVLVQTRFASHPLFPALVAHDYPAFARRQLVERRDAALPPFLHQAMLRAEASHIKLALAFLEEAKSRALSLMDGLDPQPMLYDPIPTAMLRVGGIERAQLLIESPSRQALHRLIDRWLDLLRAAGGAGAVRWMLEVDPLEI